MWPSSAGKKLSHRAHRDVIKLPNVNLETDVLTKNA
ncbi:conserved hypothetical protein [Vibrio cholerae O1 str. 2010EL-1786]|uniref:Uncharacterized protein n=2 Tax=Vibrio cholerae TaxID=666 RepID=Q9KR18_VIBCH|nr:hypothetical protein VC_1829 [Vibrio cholerae O1 biovar El Tor str. N16961]ACP06058.1 conserved hypothetical protein [Vibrio cholerae M66-2]AET26923.1 conserved hypothetical protein [Vibrio cholerae O1 str. 2010EL-1786]